MWLGNESTRTHVRTHTRTHTLKDTKSGHVQDPLHLLLLCHLLHPVRAFCPHLLVSSVCLCMYVYACVCVCVKVWCVCF